MFIAALFSIAKIQTQHKCPSINECIKICDICNICAYNVNILGIKKKESWPFVTMWIAFKGIMLSEISHTGKHKYLTYMRNLKKKKQTKKFVS